MARPKVGGLRTTRDSSGAADEPTVLPDQKSGVYQFRSRAAALRYSVMRRRIERGPDGDKEEVSFRTKDGHDAPLDWVIFEDNYFETPSQELAEALVAKVKSMGQYGVGREVWSLVDEKAEQEAATERQFRAMAAARPDLAARVFKESEAEDFSLPQA